MSYQAIIFYTVLLSSTFPLMALRIKGGNNVPIAFKRILYFRFLTDVLCFLFTIFLKNSLPLFHFSLLINFFVIFDAFRQPYSFQKWMIPLVLIPSITFIWEIMNHSIFDSIILLNSVTYLMISFLGYYILYRVPFTSYIGHVIFPLTAYYSALFFYALLKGQIDQSVLLYDELFKIFAPLTFLLNFTFTRTIWLRKLA